MSDMSEDLSLQIKRKRRIDSLKYRYIYNEEVFLESEILGEGVLGIVFRGKYVSRLPDTVLERDVAVKILEPNLWEDPNALKMFSEEAKKNWDIMQKVKSKNVVEPLLVNNFFIKEDSKLISVPFMVLPLYKGSVLKIKDSLTSMEKLKFLEDVVNGLAEVLEKSNYSHGDLHPGNIFFDGIDFAIGDFGFANISKLAGSPYIKKSGEKSAYVTTSKMQLIEFFFPDKKLNFDYEKIDVYSLGANFIYLFLDDVFSREKRDTYSINQFIREEKPDVGYKKIRKEFMSRMPFELSFLEEIIEKSFNPDEKMVFKDAIVMRSRIQNLLRTYDIDYKKNYFIERSIEQTAKQIDEKRKSLKESFKKILLGISVVALVYAPITLGILYYKNKLEKEQNNKTPTIENLLENDDTIYSNYWDFNKKVKFAFSSSRWNEILQKYNKNYGELFTKNQSSIFDIITNSVLDDWEIGPDYNEKDNSTFPNPVMLLEDSDNYVVFKIVKNNETKFLALNISKEKKISLAKIVNEIYGIEEKTSYNQTKPNTNTTTMPPTEITTNPKETKPTTPTNTTTPQTTLEDQLKEFNIVAEKEIRWYSKYSTILYSGFLELLNEKEFTRILLQDDLNKIRKLIDNSLVNGEIEKDYLNGDFGNKEVIKNIGVDYEKGFLVVQIGTDKLSQKLCSFTIGTKNIAEMNNLLVSKSYYFRPILDLASGWEKGFFLGNYDAEYYITRDDLSAILRNSNINLDELFNSNKRLVLEKIMNGYDFDGEANSFILMGNNLITNITGPDYKKYNLTLAMLPENSFLLKKAIDDYKNPVVVSPQKSEIQKTIEMFESCQESVQNYPNYESALEVILKADLAPLKSVLTNYYTDIISNSKLESILDILMDSNQENGELEYLVVTQGSNKNLLVFFKNSDNKLYKGFLSLDSSTSNNLYNYAIAINYVDSIKNSWEDYDWLLNPQTRVQGTKCLSFKPNNKTVYINGYLYRMQEAPFLYNGEVYISLRTVAEALLAAISERSYAEGYPYFYRLKYNNHTHDFYLGTNSLIKDGYKITLSSGLTLAGKTDSGFYIPATWFCDLFNLNLVWDSERQMYNLFVP
ncbi:MAG: stalk domain-containing protein [Candidatus Woesearchaeota archaeon]